MARSYYFDTNGNDKNDGLTAQTPWKHFSMLSDILLGPGDQVLLRCGCTFREQLTVNGIGAPRNPVVLTHYGVGKLPVIRRNGHIADRCVRINNASYFEMDGLEVCDGGAGIVLFYDHSYNNRSVHLRHIIAHDFFGLYRASGVDSQRDEWKTYQADDRVGFSLGICLTGMDSTPHNGDRVLTDFSVTDSEIYHTGAGLGMDWCDHRNCDGSITGWNKFGEVTFDRLYLHDNDVPGVSLTSVFLQCCSDAVFSNSVIDRGAGGATWGTAAVHLQLARRVRFENVTIKNMPHTNVSDECGIDFETDVEDCVITGCTFENNAGAAIEFLANFEMSPMAVSRNVTIENCRFINNNHAKLYTDPSQILVQVWQHDNAPTGVIRNCEYQNPEGVSLVGGDGSIAHFKMENNRQITIGSENLLGMVAPESVITTPVMATV